VSRQAIAITAEISAAPFNHFHDVGWERIHASDQRSWHALQLAVRTRDRGSAISRMMANTKETSEILGHFGAFDAASRKILIEVGLVRAIQAPQRRESIDRLESIESTTRRRRRAASPVRARRGSGRHSFGKDAFPDVRRSGQPASSAAPTVTIPRPSSSRLLRRFKRLIGD